MTGQEADGRNGDGDPGSSRENGDSAKDGSTSPPEDKARDSAKKPPPAGPHADPSLTNEDATPGTGTLPPADGEPGDGGSVSS